MANRGKWGIRKAFAAMLCFLIGADALLAADLLTIDNGSAKVGIDREVSAARTATMPVTASATMIAGSGTTSQTILSTPQ